MPDIGKRIRRRREELGMTQEELADKLHYKSKTTIAKIENGTNDIVQSKVVEFAKALRTSPAYLMGWIDIAEQNKPTAELTGAAIARAGGSGAKAAGSRVFAGGCGRHAPRRGRGLRPRPSRGYRGAAGPAV